MADFNYTSFPIRGVGITDSKEYKGLNNRLTSLEETGVPEPEVDESVDKYFNTHPFVKKVNGAPPDANGNVRVPSSGIISGTKAENDAKIESGEIEDGDVFCNTDEEGYYELTDLGNADISGIGDGTIRGAISALALKEVTNGNLGAGKLYVVIVKETSIASSEHTMLIKANNNAQGSVIVSNWQGNLWLFSLVFSYDSGSLSIEKQIAKQIAGTTVSDLGDVEKFSIMKIYEIN